MIVYPGARRADEGDVVNDLADVRNQFRQLDSRLAMRFEFPRAAEHLGAGLRGVVVFDLAGKFLAVELVEYRLGVEQVDVAGSALHPQRNHRRRFRFGMRQLRFQVEPLRLERRLARRCAQPLLIGQPGHRQTANPHRTGGEKVAAIAFSSPFGVRLGRGRTMLDVAIHQITLSLSLPLREREVNRHTETRSNLTALGKIR